MWNGSRGPLSTIAGPPGQPCGWLIITISNGTAYFGYSSDGKDITWYASYPVGNAEIIPNTATNLVIAGPGSGTGVDFNSLYAVLALYYWNGTTWVPAPTGITSSWSGTAEFVVHAWVYNYNNTAIVTWPELMNKTVPVPTPEFKP